MSNVQPYFGAFWGVREQTFGQFIEQTREFLQGLRALHPVFDTLYVLGDKANAEKPLGSNLEHLEELAFERGWGKKTPKDWFSNLDEHGRPTADSLVDVGWGFGLVNEPERDRTNDHLHLSLRTGKTSQRLNNSVLLTLHDPESPIIAPDLSERLFHYLIDFCQADRGLLTDESYRDATRDEVTREQLGWLNFRRDPGFARFLPANVTRQAYAGGIEFRIGEGRVLNANDKAEVDAGLAIQAAVRAAH
ncbi:hypothetical protein ATY41_06095 [Leifsonia xyli subsp. xyli]|uniref:Uncharacterized protein n=2 Tax=Leifsonia xyli subsp. xyli TaxID=59736 RepID=Q6AC02_LEIXX|nr:hypothetical protein [Leifsonia xyli]AAT90090.1 hypothetical protein Lxx24770 [Leifsonia xyli subsp. xyli str. CTCB07]ODA89289.1 hypothetical protein ATY41_06095 [Leifsonia xyli subsp. xyli]